MVETTGSSRGACLAGTDRLVRYRRNREARDLEALVLHYRPLAERLARRFSGRSYATDDLQQVACMGLIKALQRFDPERGHSFQAFAIPTILGELRRFCRDTAWAVRVPRRVQDRALAVRVAGDGFAAAHARTPTVSELADAVGWPVEDVVEALVAGACTRGTIPLDGEIEDDGDAGPLSERIGEIDPGFELVECIATLESSMSALTADERRVLRMRFCDELSIQQIAERVDATPSRVSRLVASGIAALRRAVEDSAAPASPARDRARRRPPQRVRRRDGSRSLEKATA